MSDELNDDKSEELARLSDDDDLLRSEPAVPALAGRIEGVHGSISTLGMRIDALVSSTTAYRSSLTDRLAEYSDLVAKLTRAQATDLDEYRRANERNLTELRRGLANSESMLDRVAARLDEMAATGDDTDGSARKLAAEVRSILDAQDRLGSFLTESLDEFSDSVLGRIASSHQEVIGSLESMRSALVTSQEATNELAEKVAAPAIRASIDELRADLQGLRRAVLEWPELTHTKEQVNALRTDVAELHERVATASSTAASTDDLAAGIDELRSALAGLRDADPSGALLDRIDALAGNVETMSSARSVDDDLAARLAAVGAELAALRDAIPDGALSAIRDEVAGSSATAAQLVGEMAGVRAVVEAIRSPDDDLAAVGAELAALRDAIPDGALSAIRDEVAGSSASAAQLVGEMAGVRAVVEAIRPPDEATLVAAVQDAVTEASAMSADRFNGSIAALRESLTDVASGEVVAGLWDEVLGIRSSIEQVAARLTPDDAPIDPFAEPETAAAAENDGSDAEDDGSDAVVAAVTELRLAIESLRTDVSSLATPPTPPAEVDAEWDEDSDEWIVGSDNAVEDEPGESPSPAAVDAELFAGLRDDLLGALEESTGASADGLAAIRAAIDELRADLDELTETPQVESGDDESPDASVSAELADFRVQVMSELDGLRQALGFIGDSGAPDLELVLDQLEALRSEVAGLQSSIASGDVATGEGELSIADDLVETLATELKALRRRIQLRASEEVFSDAQLDAIADAIAARLSG